MHQLARVRHRRCRLGVPCLGRPGQSGRRVEFYITAASSLEQAAAEKAGNWHVLVRAGAKPLPAGCGPCIGLGTDLLQDGEVGISATNRNFKGRMGSREALAYLASPKVVAASAIEGAIAGPGAFTPTTSAVSHRALSPSSHSSSSSSFPSVPKPSTAEATKTAILPGFPSSVSGELVSCDADNIDTDGIYPGKYTYQDNVPKETMAQVVMENYDATFPSIVNAGDIVISGYNFGTGSSREQAATALLAKGIKLVLAGSFGNIFSRNSINNALMTVEVPKLVKRQREEFHGQGKVLTRRTGWRVTWDVEKSWVEVTERSGKVWGMKVGELPPNVQEVFVQGGLEGWVKAQLEL